MMGTCMPLLVVTTVVGVPSASIQEMVEASVEFADALNARELQDNAPRSKNLCALRLGVNSFILASYE